jgi:hypothetical protein
MAAGNAVAIGTAHGSRETGERVSARGGEMFSTFGQDATRRLQPGEECAKRDTSTDFQRS